MTNQTKEVYFELCEQCVHYPRKESESPCDECMTVFYRPDSHKPIYFEEKEGANTK